MYQLPWLWAPVCEMLATAFQISLHDWFLIYFIYLHRNMIVLGCDMVLFMNRMYRLLMFRIHRSQASGQSKIKICETTFWFYFTLKINTDVSVHVVHKTTIPCNPVNIVVSISTDLRSYYTYILFLNFQNPTKYEKWT